MIRVSSLDGKKSSPKNIYGNENALAQREDIYTGEDFWFGFDSSNQSFMDIIGGKKPLAIKYGPLFSLYEKTVDGLKVQVYYIDVQNKALLPLVTIKSVPSQTALAETLVPWYFGDFYLERTLPIEAKAADNLTEIPLLIVLEKLSKNLWPTATEMESVKESVTSLNANPQELSVTLHTIDAIKEAVTQEVKRPTEDKFVAPYNPFLDNERFDKAFLLDLNQKYITVRHIPGKYERIEIVIPGEKNYCPIFRKKNPELYTKFKNALSNQESLSSLLKENFPEDIEAYFEKQDLPVASIVASSARNEITW